MNQQVSAASSGVASSLSMATTTELMHPREKMTSRDQTGISKQSSMMETMSTPLTTTTFHKQYVQQSAALGKLAQQ